MRTRKSRLAAAGGVLAAALVMSACGGGGSGSSSGGAAEFDAGSHGIVNPSDAKGGTLRFGNSDDFDSTDPGNTYYGYGMDFVRFYARSLLTYQTMKVGPEGGKFVPDLAEGMGKASDGNKTWTYKIKKGLKYEDGSPIKSEDVKWAVMRTFDRSVLGSGPSYLSQVIKGAKKEKKPYQDKNWKKFKGIDTPDDQTIVFHLAQPFAEFDSLVGFSGQTAPVPHDKDKGKTYALHPISSGPYKWQGNYKPGKGGTLVRNKYWDPKTDPNRKALPDKVTVQAGLDANELDQRLMSGDLDVDVGGTGVQDQARAKILGSDTLKKNADDGLSPYTYFNPITPVISNVHCRRAMVYATDRGALFRAYGGDSGGQFATNVMSPNVPNRETITKLYPWDPKSPDAKSTLNANYHGDPAKAKQELKACGKPKGFSTKMVYRSDRPKEKAVAQAMEQSLGKVGIKLTLKGYPSGTYTSDQLGSPAFVKKNKIGLGTYGWGADWPTGYGFLNAISSGDAIVPSGNSNISEIKDFDKQWADVVKESDPMKRAKVYGQIEKGIMEKAYWIPNIYSKSLIYRPDNLTNAYMHAGYGMYDYVNLGVK